VAGVLVGSGFPVAVGVVYAKVDEGAAVVGGSLQAPNQPGQSHVLVGCDDDVVVMVGAGAAEGVVTIVEDAEVVVMGSLQPNQPGVLQVEVVVEEVLVVVVDVGADVVVSSKQPHQPGVLQVSVRVRVDMVELLVVVVVIGSLPLLSKNFQLKQSWHSTSSSQ